MGDLIIENEAQLKAMLYMFLKESQEHLDTEKEEKRRQRAAAKAVRELEANDDKASRVAEQDSDKEAEGDPDKSKDISGEVPSAEVARPSEEKVVKADMKDIIRTLNVMRSGRSTKDPAVKKALKTYIDGLTTGEQQSLFVFLSGLSQMMVGDASGAEATDPQQVGIKTKPADAEDEKGQEGSVSVEKKKATKKKSDKDGQETPIVVGEAADKSRELSILNKIRGK